MPLPIKTVMLLGDIFMKDPLPIVDEVLMLLMYFNSVGKIIWVMCFVKKHKVVIGVAIILMLVLAKRVFGGEVG